jgi:cytochrome d ubiquinol oxidase subunit I
MERTTLVVMSLAMDPVLVARAQMGLSLAFHIVFAAVGIGLPLILVLAEVVHRRTGDPEYLELAQHLGKGTAVLFAVGAVSGTVLSFELGILWPRFMGAFGDVVGPLFGLEGLAFFLEAIFIGIYLYGRGRVSPRVHLASACIVAVSGALSAAFVTLVNAWMNEPAGVRWDGSRVTSIELAQAMLSPSGLHQIVHGTLACYAATSWAMVGVHTALARYPGRRSMHQKAQRLALWLAVVSSLAMPLTGDRSAKHVASQQPWKLAAMEAHFVTEAAAPLRLGGVADPDARALHGAVEIPSGLSILAWGDPKATVTGLDAFPRDEWPPVTKVHLAFDCMVGAGSLLAALALVALGLLWRRPLALSSRLMTSVLLGASPLGFVALEAGWCVTEWGRQPFVARGLLRTRDALTERTHLDIRFVGFALVYLLLAVLVAAILRSQWRASLAPVKSATQVRQ